MAQQVAGNSEATLQSLITSGEVAQPTLMTWNEWQRWRHDVGRRPVQATDGYQTTNAQEAALWRSIMLDLYGTDWGTQLMNRDMTDAAEEAPPGEPSQGPAAGAAEGSQPRAGEPSQGPATAATEVPPVVTPRPHRATDTSPGSGLGR